MAVSHASEHSDAIQQHSLTVLTNNGGNSHLELTTLDHTTTRNTAFTWTRFYATVLKRTVDILVAVVALLFLGLAMIIVAIAIRIDSPGPVLFQQDRVGIGGRSFRIYKFRTMVQDAGPAVRYFVSSDGKLRHKVRNDPRVTRVGAALRRTSIDELPQLINVLRGDMSLIGPRPELVEIVRTYQPWQHRRHSVRPGLTGWWQVSGRSNRPMHENTELDLYYVDHISPGLDLKILIRTIHVVLKGRGAF